VAVEGSGTGCVGLPVSPASPEYAISVCSFRLRVLSSSAFRIVAPRMAAFEAAMMVKSLPVMPSKTSLKVHQYEHYLRKHRTYMLAVLGEDGGCRSVGMG